MCNTLVKGFRYPKRQYKVRRQYGAAVDIYNMRRTEIQIPNTCSA